MFACISREDIEELGQRELRLVLVLGTAIVRDCIVSSNGGPPERCAALHSELAALTPSALRRRATDAGATNADMEEMLDADDPKADRLRYRLRIPSVYRVD